MLADDGDLTRGKHEGPALVLVMTEELVLAARDGVPSPGRLDLRVDGEHVVGRRTIGAVEPRAQQRLGVRHAVFEELRREPELRCIEGPQRIGFGIPTAGAGGVRGADGLDERGETHAGRGDIGSVEVVVDAEAADARLGPGGDVRAVLGGEGRIGVGGAVGADPREDGRAELDARCPQRLQIREHADGMTLALEVALRRPDGIRDGVVEAENVVGADGTVAIPTFGLRGVVELHRVVHAERDGEGFGVLAEVFAGILGADLRSPRVVEVGIRIEAVAFRDARLAADHREEHRLLFPEFDVKDAVKAVGEFRGATEADGAGPIFGEFVEAAQLTPAEVGTEFIRAREAQLIARTPVGAEFTRESEEDAEVLFAEASHGDARGGRIVAQEEDGLAHDRASRGITFFRGRLDAGRAGGGGAADIHGEGRAAHALGFVTGLGADAGHAFAPIGEGASRMEFLDLGLGREDDRRPDAGVEKAACARGDGEKQKAGQGQDSGHGVRQVIGGPRVSSSEYRV